MPVVPVVRLLLAQLAALLSWAAFAATPALPALPALPTLPRSAITAGELAVVIADGDALSEAVGTAYQRARGIPEAHVVRVALPAGRDAITAAEFAAVKAAIDARLGPAVQATLLTFTQPSRVQGERCAASITAAMAFGFDARLCGQCAPTLASPYYDSDSTRPYTDLRIRPSMMLGARTLAEAEALIARGLAADGSQPAGTGYALRTSDAARSVRWPDLAALPAAWRLSPGLAWQYLDHSASAPVSAPASAQTSAPAGTAGLPAPNLIEGRQDVLFYFTGLVKVDKLDTLRFLPGAVADHLTSTGGVLPDGQGQMTALAWLAAGATGSYGTVEEPCNHVQKFPRATVLVDHYLRGATLIEAYWKSVAWPGQGLFVGEPLARPWPDAPEVQIVDGELRIQTRSLRRGATYRIAWQRNAASPWQVLAHPAASRTAGQPQAVTWRVPLGPLGPLGPLATAGGRLGLIGPCPLRPAQSCLLGP